MIGSALVSLMDAQKENSSLEERIKKLEKALKIATDFIDCCLEEHSQLARAALETEIEINEVLK